MSFGRILARRSTLAGLANILFAGGLLLLFAALYRQASYRSPLLLIAVLLLAGAIGCWIAAAQWGRTPDDLERSG